MKTHRGRPKGTAPIAVGDDSTPSSYTGHAPRSSREGRTVPLSERLTWGLDDIAELTGLNRRTLERLRSAGKFPPPDLRIGKRVLWRPETVRRWIEGGGRCG